MSRRVLIVTPNWPPMSFPDLHRVRTALPYLGEFGWEPLILRIDPRRQEGLRDEQLRASVPESVLEWTAGCVPASLTSWFGLRNAALRSFFHLAVSGLRIIREQKPDVVFFSTTMFPLMVLGRLWKALSGVPYVLDFQDPWFTEYPAIERAGLKRRLTQRAAAVLEPLTLREAAHTIAVSPAYGESFLKRYSWIDANRLSTLPFGAPHYDFDVLDRLPVRQMAFRPDDGLRHWIYAGRGGDDLLLSIRAFLLAMSRARRENPSAIGGIRLHLIGTSYATETSSSKSVESLANALGVGDLVCETTGRLPYYEALQCLKQADALVVFGSDDAGYTASKIYPYILARKPLLAIFHKASSVVDVIESSNAGTVVTFDNSDDSERIAERIYAQWFSREIVAPPLNQEVFERYSARRMTERLCKILTQSAGDGHA